MTEAFFFYLALQLGDGAMKVYTIIGGVNGTGKTSLTGVLKTQRTDLGTIIDVDKITAQNGGSATLGYKITLEHIQNLMNKGVNFTLETSLLDSVAEQTAAKAKALGYYIRLCYVGLDTLEESLARIENRVRRGGHDIRDKDVIRRFAGRWEAVAKVLPYCDEARFFDNDNGFIEVAEYVNGELLQKGEKIHAWCKELTEYLKSH
jgi:predicted ABC-type ATPase